MRLRPIFAEATKLWPRYAYTTGRSIDHAIIRALYHCSQVQQILASQRLTLRERRHTGRKPTSCQGGVTLSIDTSKAFDTVNRQVLEQELRAARVPEPELAVILNLHHCIGYWPAGQDPPTRVASERGVRQGCPLAPSLWTLITIALFRALAGVTSVTWLQEDTTMFADDLLLQWIVHRVQDLENMVDIIAHTFRILAQLGLQVQHRKTQLIVAYKGRQATQWWRAHTATTAEGRFLLIPQPGSKALRLPIVTKLTYLGIILSYVDATTATVDHRLQVAEAQRARLLKVLHSRTLPTTKRVQLWQACVRSSALYGLHLVDLQQRHVVRITVTLVRHLRAIARSFAHMTQESSRALLERLNVEDPLLSLLQRSQKLLVKTRESSDPMVARPRIMHWLVHFTESKLALTSHLDRTVAEPLVINPSPQDADLQSEAIAAASPTLLPGPLKGVPYGAPVAGKHGPRTTRFSCPTCDLWFPDLDTVSALRSHNDPVRAPSVPTPATADPPQESLGTTVLEEQIPATVTEVTTTATAPVVPYTVAAPTGSPLDGLLPEKPEDWLRFARQPKAQELLRQFCTTCGQWLVSVKSVKLHYRSGNRGSDVPDNRNGPSKMPSGDHALLHRVAKALIVQADYLSRLQSDHTVIFTFRTGNGPQLMVPLLQEVATTWREQRQQNKVTRSLKQTLIQYLAAELVTRINAFSTDTESQKRAQELGWITSEGEFNFLDWDFEDKKLVPRQEVMLTHDQILTDAKRLKALLKNPDLVLKFSGGRNAKPDSTSETATFVLELSMQQPEASEAMAIFRKWYANSALLLLSLRLKPARPERSPLIKEIQEAVGW
ncbi:yfiL [Symbiodinium sp. CCMP2592]|nr:yfiL [Symbiodinium sp. CCMP2592]